MRLMRAARSSRAVTQAPPSPAAPSALLGKKLNVPMSPSVPAGAPSWVAPSACAASSTMATPGAASRSGAKSWTRPKRSTDTRARVRGEVALSTARGSSESADRLDIDEDRARADAHDRLGSRHEPERAEVITSSPGPTPNARSATTRRQFRSRRRPHGRPHVARRTRARRDAPLRPRSIGPSEERARRRSRAIRPVPRALDQGERSRPSRPERLECAVTIVIAGVNRRTVDVDQEVVSQHIELGGRDLGANPLVLKAGRLGVGRPDRGPLPRFCSAITSGSVRPPFEWYACTSASALRFIPRVEATLQYKSAPAAMALVTTRPKMLRSEELKASESTRELRRRRPPVCEIDRNDLARARRGSGGRGRREFHRACRRAGARPRRDRGARRRPARR